MYPCIRCNRYIIYRGMTEINLYPLGIRYVSVLKLFNKD